MIKYTTDKNQFIEVSHKKLFDRFLGQDVDLMKALDSLDKKIAKAKEKVKELEAELDALNGELPIECQSSSNGEGCGAIHKIKDIVYIQSFWYTSPHGCSGGDYWNYGEGRFRCPSCGVKNRLYNRTWYDQFSNLFKSIEKEYDRR